MQFLRDKFVWFDGLWLLMLTLYIVGGASTVPFHGDESTQIYMGRDYYYLFVEGNLNNVLYDETWSNSATEQHLRLLNGTISKTLYGWVYAQNGYAIDDINEQWDWGADYTYNQNTYRIPDKPILQQTRLISAIQTALAMILLFGIGRYTLNRPTAYIASLYITLNPNFLLNGRRAMMEGSQMFGLVLLVFIALWLADHRKWWAFALLGIVTGFAVATKHPNAFIAGLTFLMLLASTTFQVIQKRLPRQQLFTTTIRLVIAGLIALTTFYILNPAWWGNPVTSAQQALSLRNDLLQMQSSTFESYTSIGERLTGLFDFVFIGQPQFYEATQWATYNPITQQISAYQSSIWSGIAIGGTTIGGWFVLIITVAGIGLLVKNDLIPLDQRWLLAGCTVGISLITLAVTPLAWARYYLPIYPFVSLIFAYGLTGLAGLIWKRFKQ